MSAREWLSASLMATLHENARLDPLTVFDAPPVRGAVPFLVIAEPELRQADAAGLTGRQARIAIELVDMGERPKRLRMLQERAEEAVLGMEADLGGEGWRIAALTLVRSRVMRAGDTRWRGSSEFSGFVYRAN